MKLTHHVVIGGQLAEISVNHELSALGVESLTVEVHTDGRKHSEQRVEEHP